MIYFSNQFLLVAEQLQVYSPPLIAQVKFQQDYFSEYPQQIRIANQSTILYDRKPGYYAVHYNQPNSVTDQAVLQLNDGAIGLFTGEPDELNNTLSPIYTLQPDGSLAVPTGLIFIRFVAGVNVESRREAIKQAGYEVTDSLSYAPQAAWLRAQSGKILDALVGISRLEAIPDVENIEPQMLMARVQR
ncbi:MAG: hypothetical protein KME05_24300 [Gloeocapsa sp. UFS-A4-WI-NPMV-4B04]|jgi:hypothetical protein|nr:hypothetical protein [Gloeocapsa sp. UFS-A4-WI-NPMV-4B04]